VISVDASVWVAFLEGQPAAQALVKLLGQGLVEVHRYVYTELTLRALGARRGRFLAQLERLVVVEPEEHVAVVDFVARHGLGGAGIGYVDAHVLCSGAAEGSVVWSLSERVQRAAAAVGVAVSKARLR
jgi:predicted nucleic acid-binding protein